MPVFVVRGIQIVVVGVLAGLAIVAGVGMRASVESDTSTIPVVEIGPPVGLRVEGHHAAASAALGLATGRRVAVASFHGYLSVDQVQAMVAEVGDLDVDGYLVAIPGSMPAFVLDVEFWVRDQVFDAESQLRELEELAPTVDDPEFRAFYEDEIRRYATLQSRADSPAVFAVVVTGPVDSLRALAGRSELRLVDVGVGDRLADDAVVRGLRPEEVQVVGTPEIRP